MNEVIIAGKQLDARVLPLLEPERRSLGAHLSRRNVMAACTALSDTYMRLERNMADAIHRSGLTPACRRGCGWCCHGVKVNVTALEALVIARHLVNLNEELCGTIRATAERRRQVSSDELFSSGEPCPFLGASNDCTIHAVRPIACRRHSCVDATECERAVKNPKLKLPVSQHSSVLAVGAIAGLALSAALEDAHLDYREFELTSAVDVAFGSDAGERWVHGEQSFDPAVRPVDALDRAVAEADIRG